MAYDKDNKGSSDAASKISKRFSRGKKKKESESEEEEESFMDRLKKAVSKPGIRDRYESKKKKK